MSTHGTLRHTEQWFFAISRDETDTWPDCLASYSGMAERPKFRPTEVTVSLHRDARSANLAVAGFCLKSDGTPGRAPVTACDYDIDRIGDTTWLSEVVDHWRRVLGLGPGATGVDWT